MACILLASLLLLHHLSCLAQTSRGAIILSSLPNTLDVDASPHYPDQNSSMTGTWYFMGMIKSGRDILGVSWGLNQTLPARTEAAYKTVKFNLCHASEKPVDNSKYPTEEKKCPIEVFTRPYRSSSYNATSKFEYYESTLVSHVPAGLYFVRAYVYDGGEAVVAYGQSTGPNEDYNLFSVEKSSASHKSTTVDMVLLCVGAFSILFMLG